jgi:ATP/maltotriose-dependent transcriptional regulator MalT
VAGAVGANAPVLLLLLDPLSDREETVLRNLPTVRSRAEIVYRKLGVGTRTEAVRRAQPQPGLRADRHSDQPIQGEP